MSTVSLLEAATRYVGSLDGDDRVFIQAEVNRFARWYGLSRPLDGLRGHEVSLYAEELGPATPDAKRRAEHVKGFLAFLKKEGLASENFGTHLKLKKGTKSLSRGAGGERRVIELTADGHKALQNELESLKGQRPQVREDIRKAMQDKDFRENAPLDAAKEKQAHLESRIRDIEQTLKHAEVVDGKAAAGAGSRVHIGSTVSVTNLGSGAALRYTIVGESEGNASAGKISNVSPIGKALVGRSAGEEVEVSVPAGVLRLRVDSIEG
ncbi:MAG: transcription elongation factor GreA [Dehalococcoidia bacterium]